MASGYLAWSLGTVHGISFLRLGPDRFEVAFLNDQGRLIYPVHLDVSDVVVYTTEDVMLFIQLQSCYHGWSTLWLRHDGGSIGMSAAVTAALLTRMDVGDLLRVYGDSLPAP